VIEPMEPRDGRPTDGRPRARPAVASLVLFAVFLLPAVALGMIASPGGSEPASAATVRAYANAASVDLASAGQVLFLQSCSSCHGPLGQGTDQGPVIIGLGPANYSFQMSTGRMPLAEPGAQGLRRPPVLSPGEIDAIIAYLASLDPAGVPIPNVHPAAGDLSQGGQIYLGNCAPCHSASGNGGSVGKQVAPSLHRSTATQIGEAVRIGPGTMPVFDAREISDDELNSLVRYVLYLRNPPAPGGLDLGNFGPIVEGLGALVVGLATIVLVTRYIGARS
jgi:ubiquinol-cytochrome c reductase cytochrome c subunit